ncbi:transposase [Comamonas aquatica DA1877]|uniref:Transposase n=3 Tax=Comamonadaceae TaxID=80864 RepID=A0A014Q730_9BURK|nr:DUF1153 domain-containing protein [Comamonas aquatica]EXU79022.1 transposase [Comamonas aquatica DA1877]
MSTLMEDDIKRWTAKRKTALVLDIIQGKTTISEASRAFDLNPSEVEQWVDEGKRGMENALRTKPLEVKEQYRLRQALLAKLVQVVHQQSVKHCPHMRVPLAITPRIAAQRDQDTFGIL